MALLPEDFLASMQKLLGNEYEDFLKSYDKKNICALRVNRSRISAGDFKKIAPYPIKEIPFIDNGFYINENDPWTKHPYYFAGLYYIQEPSAMLPANVLPVNDGDKVLDLCAAPGGKSSELATKANCMLVANDISFSRTIPLKKNLELSGAGSIYITNESPQKLKAVYGEYFDRILVDAPCSGEGMFRKDNSLIKEYLKRKPEDYAPLQKEIISDAFCMLRPGGYMLYSTCTFSPKEDEEVIRYLLDCFDNARICEIGSIPGAYEGYDEYSKECPSLKNCIHIFPHRVDGEGHFMALIKKQEKEEAAEETFRQNTDKNLIEYKKLPREVIDFFDLLSDGKREELKCCRYIINDNMVFLLDSKLLGAYRSKLHYIRTGCLVGSINNKGGFTPYTGFALTLEKNDFKNVCDLPSTDPLVLKYLKGETLIIEEEDRFNGISKGFTLILTDGFALGFAKSDGCRLKNLYEKGWRLS